MRYLVLVLLNLPVIFLAFINITTQYKLGKITKNRFNHQLVAWLLVFIVVTFSFPFYNFIVGRPLFDSATLSAFDIVQTTTIVLLFYIVNRQRQRIDNIEKRLRDFHQAISIKTSDD